MNADTVSCLLYIAAVLIIAYVLLFGALKLRMYFMVRKKIEEHKNRLERMFSDQQVIYEALKKLTNEH